MALNLEQLDKNVVALVGGVGGAKLAYGLAQLVPPERLTVIVNVADDFWHYGLRICPDLDTIVYTLSGLVDPVNGWGVAGDSTHMLDMLRQYGEDPWFRLGDRDLATHLLRTQRLHSGQRLTEVTRDLARQAGVPCAVLPVTDDPVATRLDTVEYGELDFQTYFVKYRWQPTLRGMRYQGIEAARLSPEVEQALDQADVILFGPSNPWLSLEPLLAIPGLRDRLRARSVPRVAVTPLIGGKAVKGPTAKIMVELNYEVSPGAVARFYGDTITHFVVDVRDSIPRTEPADLHYLQLDTLMPDDASKMRLARQILLTLEGVIS